jgi:uncharacterized membrane protein
MTEMAIYPFLIFGLGLVLFVFGRQAAAKNESETKVSRLKAIGGVLMVLGVLRIAVRYFGA